MTLNDANHRTVMTVADVAAFLRLSESTVYRLAQEGKLPGRKIGGAWRFLRPALEQWLAQPVNSVLTSGKSKRTRELS